MPTTPFLEVALEIRNQIYEELLVFELLIEIMTKWGKLRGGSTNPTKRFGLWLSILSVNKQINFEACTILYSKNDFTFIRSCNTYTLTPFLRNIGPQSASFIRKICIEFQTFEDNDFDESYGIALPIGVPDKTSFKVDDVSTRTLRDIRTRYTNLMTLKMSLQSACSLRHKVDENSWTRSDTNVISILDKELRAMPKLTQIIVGAHVGFIDGASKRAMNCYGWSTKLSLLGLRYPVKNVHDFTPLVYKSSTLNECVYCNEVDAI